MYRKHAHRPAHVGALPAQRRRPATITAASRRRAALTQPAVCTVSPVIFPPLKPNHNHSLSLSFESAGQFPAAELTRDHDERERRWFVLERPRRDTNGGSETEVTVTSKRHAQAEMIIIVTIMKSSRNRCRERRVGFVENTARQHRRGG